MGKKATGVGAGAPKGNKRNPNIGKSEAAKKRQFGQPEGNPKRQDLGYPAWSIRGAQKHMAAQPIDVTDESALNKMMGRTKMTIAEAIALKQLRKALAGQDRAMEAVADNVDGKLPVAVKQDLTITEPAAPVNPDEIATHEGLDDAHKQLLNG